jgi:hypothetical protein
MMWIRPPRPRAAAWRLRGTLPVALAVFAGELQAQERAPAVISGSVRAADFGPVAGATVRVRGGRSTLRLERDGEFRVEAHAGAGSHVELEVVLEGYYPSVRRVAARTGRTPPLLLVPRRWTITTGRFAGEVVEIDLEGATGAACGSCGAFYGKVLGGEKSPVPPGIPTWPARSFPLEVAFDRENGALVSARDSVAFWRVVRALEDHFGLRLFHPAPLASVLANVDNDGPGSLLVLIDPRLLSTGWGSSVAQAGDILAGAVHFRHARTFSLSDGPVVVAHEIFHALGFGHTCRWRSIVADVRRCRSRQASMPTPSDVAHAQLLWRIRDIERGVGVWTTIASAMAAYPLASH